MFLSWVPGSFSTKNPKTCENAPNSKLICFEINDNFYGQLKDRNHPQLIVLNISAEKIADELKRLKINKVNYIISSLPLTIIPDDISDEILDKSFNVDWNTYRNSIILTDGVGFKVMKTNLFRILDVTK